MSLATWSAIIRNGLCVYKTVLPKDNFLLQVVPGGFLPGVNYAEYIIGVNQVVGVLYNIIGGYHDVVAGSENYFLLKKYLATLDKMAIVHGADVAEYTILRHGATAELKSSRNKLIVGICKFNIGAGFMYLVANTLHLPMTNFPKCLFDALTVVLASLLVILLIILCGISSQFALTRRLNKLVTRMADSTQAKSPFMVVCLATEAGFTDSMSALQLVDSSFVPAYKTSDFSSEGIKRDLDTLTGVLNDKKRQQHSLYPSFSREMHDKARLLTFSTLFDVLFLLLNFVAFYGYTMGTLAFYRSTGVYGAPGGSHLRVLVDQLLFGLTDDNASYWGFLAGDVAWTVEPSLALVVPGFLSYLAELTGSGKSKKKAD